MAGLGERSTVPLVEAHLLNKPLGPTKAARVIEKTTASGMKGRELAEKIKRASKRLMEWKGSPVGRIQNYDSRSIRSLLLSDPGDGRHRAASSHRKER